MLAAILLSTAIVIAVIVYSLCKAAGEADKAMERAIKREYDEGYKWCDDECLYCEKNDWCKFSEVKREV